MFLLNEGCDGDMHLYYSRMYSRWLFNVEAHSLMTKFYLALKYVRCPTLKPQNISKTLIRN